jgi:hypothetical protein
MSDFAPVTFKVMANGEEVIQTCNSQEEMEAFNAELEALRESGQEVGEPEIVTQ